MKGEDEISGELPEALVQQLKAAEERRSLITASVDRSLDGMVQAQFANRPRRRSRAAPGWLAVAASVLLALFVVQSQRELPENPVYGDINNSGQVNIADVLSLARRDDGKVTQQELDAFAQQIVSLGDAS